MQDKYQKFCHVAVGSWVFVSRKLKLVVFVIVDHVKMILDTHIYSQKVVSTFPIFIQYYPFTIRSNIAHIKVNRGRYISYFGREFQWDDNYPIS